MKLTVSEWTDKWVYELNISTLQAAIDHTAESAGISWRFLKQRQTSNVSGEFETQNQ